jgi:CheY-like chemotaxis protein
MLAVRDTGTGMSSDTLAHIFEPFFTTKPSGKGTGLGLSIVHGIIQQCGGHIRVESEAGVGTVFRLYFPAVEAPPETAEGPGTDAAATPASGTVLVVEDDDALRSVVCQIIRDDGFRVLEAASAEEALNLTSRREGPIDLLLSDVVMPGMGGRRLAEQLTSRYPDLRVLFMSGYTDDAIIRQGVSNATANLIMKPFTPASLLQRMRETLRENARHPLEPVQPG